MTGGVRQARAQEFGQIPAWALKLKRPAISYGSREKKYRPYLLLEGCEGLASFATGSTTGKEASELLYPELSKVRVGQFYIPTPKAR